MKALEDHERALLLVLKDGSHPAEAFEALLEHPDVRAWRFPPPWVLDHAGIDLIAARPGLGTIDRDTLRGALDALIALADEAALDRALASADPRAPLEAQLAAISSMLTTKKGTRHLRNLMLVSSGTSLSSFIVRPL